MSSEAGDGFLARWARRKAEAQRAGAEAEIAETAETPVAGGEEPPFDISTLPTLDSLTATSDITAFLQKGVPAALRNAALQKMWVLDESIRTYVGPSEMSWDFNAPGAIFGHGPLAAESDLSGMLADIADHRWLKPVEESAETLPATAPAARDEAVAIAAPEPADGGHTPVAPDTTKVEECDDLPPVRHRHGGATPR